MTRSLHSHNVIVPGGEKLTGGKDGSSHNWPGKGDNPPLFVDGDSFEFLFHSDGSVNDWGYLFTVEAVKSKGGGGDAAGKSRGDISVPLSLSASVAMESYFHLSQLMLDGPGPSPGSSVPPTGKRSSDNEGGDDEAVVAFDAYPTHTHCTGYVDFYVDRQTIGGTALSSSSSSGSNPSSSPSSSTSTTDNAIVVLPKNPKYVVADSHLALALGLTAGGSADPSPCPEVFPVELMRGAIDDPYIHLAEAGDLPFCPAIHINPFSWSYHFIP